MKSFFQPITHFSMGKLMFYPHINAANMLFFSEQLIKNVLIWVWNITIKYKLQLKITFSFNFFI